MIELEKIVKEDTFVYESEAGNFNFFVGTRFLDPGFMPRLNIIAAFMEQHDAEWFKKERCPRDGGWEIYKRKARNVK